MNDSNAHSMLKALAYAKLFSGNASMESVSGARSGGSNDFVTVSRLTFSIPFSISNVIGLLPKETIDTFRNKPVEGVFPGNVLNNTTIDQLIYDTSSQSVREYIDKPYAVAGLFVIGFVNSNDIDQGISASKWQNDLDDYEQIYLAGGGYIFMGTCKSSQTDFYTPLQDITKLIYIDPVATVKPYIGGGSTPILSQDKINQVVGGNNNYATWTPRLRAN